MSGIRMDRARQCQYAHAGCACPLQYQCDLFKRRTAVEEIVYYQKAQVVNWFFYVERAGYIGALLRQGVKFLLWFGLACFDHSR